MASAYAVGSFPDSIRESSLKETSLAPGGRGLALWNVIHVFHGARVRGNETHCAQRHTPDAYFHSFNDPNALTITTP